MMVDRYLPSIVLIVWVLLIVAGVPPAIMRVPGLLALSVALALWTPAEARNVRSERRRKTDRRA